MTASDTPVGLVGLGLVGRALAKRLAGAGLAVLGHDHRADAMAAWAATGGAAAASATELGARCRQVVLAVYDTAGVLDVIEGTSGVLAGGSPEVFIDCSTGDPDALEKLATRLCTRGIDFIEAPLSGSSRQIETGEATALIGADAQALARHARVLEALAPRRIVAGGAGMGARAKLATNLVLGLNRAALAEGMVFAERLGIPPATFLQLVLATPARSDAASAKGHLMVTESFAPQSRIHQHLKDVMLMLDQARSAGQRLLLSEAHAALLRAAVDAGDGELDNAAIVRQIRRCTTGS